MFRVPNFLLAARKETDRAAVHLATKMTRFRHEVAFSAASSHWADQRSQGSQPVSIGLFGEEAAVFEGARSRNRMILRSKFAKAARSCKFRC
jgi:hypothetical protein